ncbi:MAG: tRNA nucleotidyltransferase [Sphingobacteriaceae bacterium]|nr:tRNA nucleotidyltransferase [Sphingobacteriaceae bacterium]
MQFEHKLPEHPFEWIRQQAELTQTTCYVIGGYVRDLVLGRPNKDIDILVLGGGIDFAKQLSVSLPKKAPLTVFKTYGTAMLRLPDLELEFVGARRESYRSDSRKPLVEDGSLEDDVARRDFTVNAVAIEIYPNFGQLVDLYNGMADLELGRLVTPLEPNITFSDDPLRMMRAIRFATQLKFQIDPATFAAIKANVERIDIVSAERITDELNKIILAPQPSIGFRLLFDSGLLHRIFPEMAALQGVKTQNGMSHKDNFYHTLKVLDNISRDTNDLWLRWAAILHDIAKPPTQRFEEGIGWTFHGHEDMGARMVPKIFRRLRLPLHEEMRRVQKLVRLHLRPIALTKTTVTDSAVRRLIFEVGDDIDSLMTLCKADITSKNEIKVRRYLQNFLILEEKLQQVVEADRIRLLQPPVTGDEIMAFFGIPAGREVGIIKNTIKDAIVNGIIENTREEAWELMKQKGIELGLTLPQ